MSIIRPAWHLTVLLAATLGVGATSCGHDPAPPAPASAAGTVSVVLVSSGPNKIQAIKLVREMTGLGLAASKDLVDHVPSTIRKDVSRDVGVAILARLTAIGATAEIRDASAASR